MRIVFAAVCQNPECRHVDTIANAIGLGDGASIHFSDNISVCTVCGSESRIPGGDYKRVGRDILFEPVSPSEMELFRQAERILREALSNRPSPDEFIEKAEKEAPGLKKLWRLTPRDQTDAIAIWGLMLLAFQTILMTCQALSQPAQPHIKVEVELPADIIDAIRSSRADTHDDSRTTGQCASSRQSKPPE